MRCDSCRYNSRSTEGIVLGGPQNGQPVRAECDKSNIQYWNRKDKVWKSMLKSCPQWEPLPIIK